MSDDRIKFTYGEVKAQLSQDGKTLEYENDTGNKLRQGLQNIFNAIRKLEGDNKKIDTAQETQLLNKLQSIFQAGDSNTIDDDELNWAKGFAAGGDVVNFIDTKYNEVVGTEQSRVNYNNPILITETPEEISSFEGDYTEVPGFEDDVYMVKQDVYIPNIDNDYCLGFITDTPEKAKEYKQQFETELAKIKYIAEVSDAEWEQAYAQNMQAIENIAALANYNKDVLDRLIVDYIIKEDNYVDPKSPEYNSFVQRLLDTRDADVVQRLDLLVYNREYNIENDVFRGNEDTFKALAALYKEVRDKECIGESLNDNEKELKAYFKNYEVECGYRYNEDLRMVYDGNGDFRYQGKPYGFEHGSDADPHYNGLGVITVIAGTTKEIVRNFQNDYTEACEAIANAPDGDEDQVTEAQFKALFKKYANNTDDSFACSVLTSELLEYADMEDIKTAINANGAEYLKYLECALERENFGFDEEKLNDVRLAMSERAVELFTHAERGNVSNMLHLKGIMDLIDNTDFTGADEIVGSYFYRTENGELVYQGRRMTEEEIEAFCNALPSWMDCSEYVTAIFNKFGNEPEVRIAVFKILEKCEGISDEIRISLIKDYMTENEDGTYTFNEEAFDNAFESHSLIYRALPKSKIDITSNPEELSGNETEYQKIWNAVFDWTGFIVSTESWAQLKNSLYSEEYQVPQLDPETGEQVIDPETGEPVYDLEVNQENLLEFDRRFFEKLQNSLTPGDTRRAMKILAELGYAYESTEEFELIAQLKNETVEIAITRLAEDPTKEKIDNTIAIINSLGVDTGSFQEKAKPTIAAAIAKLQENPDPETLRSLINFANMFGLGTEILQQLNITNAGDKKKDMQNVMFEGVLKNTDIDLKKKEDLIANGWIEGINEITSYRKGRTIFRAATMFRAGDHDFEIDNDNKVKVRSAKGTQAGLNILDGIKGWNTTNGPQHRKAREELDNIDKESVVDTILAFNEASSNYSDGTRIMEYLDGERRGMTVESMIKVPEALIAWGQENGKDVAALQAAVDSAKRDGLNQNSFPEGIAQKLDQAMLDLINS